MWSPLCWPPCQRYCESTTACWYFGSAMRTSVLLSNWPSRTTSALDGSSVSSSQTRTTQPSDSGLSLLFRSRCKPQRHSRIVFFCMRRSWTRPRRAPIDSTHLTIVGHFSAFDVQTPSLSGLPCSQKPLSSSSPVADVIGAKNVFGSLPYVTYVRLSHSSFGISGPEYLFRLSHPPFSLRTGMR